jgi:hypothetical protein
VIDLPRPTAIPGVQGRDLTSLFAQIETWAIRHRVPLYALRRDQQKGFDRLSPEGFYDAVHAYGLPEQLIQLDIFLPRLMFRTPLRLRMGSLTLSLSLASPSRAAHFHP